MLNNLYYKYQELINFNSQQIKKNYNLNIKKYIIDFKLVFLFQLRLNK